MIEIGIRKIMENHYYKFGGKNYRQTKGGAIGLHITGSLARICMDNWATLMKMKMEDNLIKWYLMEKYVDDVNWVLELLGLGVGEEGYGGGCDHEQSHH